jgi:hypothetical protein
MVKRKRLTLRGDDIAKVSGDCWLKTTSEAPRLAQSAIFDFFPLHVQPELWTLGATLNSFIG